VEQQIFLCTVHYCSKNKIKMNTCILEHGEPHDLEEDERRHLGPHSPAMKLMISLVTIATMTSLREKEPTAMQHMHA
jgi:hypothetical protein